MLDVIVRFDLCTDVVTRRVAQLVAHNDDMGFYPADILDRCFFVDAGYFIPVVLKRKHRHFAGVGVFFYDG